MIVKSLYLLFLLTFLVLPFFYHRKKSKPSMTKFYLRMAFSHNFRKCYRLVLLSTLLMFHFYHLSLFKLPLELAPSSVVCLLLFSQRNSERVFRIFCNLSKRKFHSGIIFDKKDGIRRKI